MKNKNKNNKLLIAATFATAVIQPVAAIELDWIDGVDMSAYGSLRISAEAVRPDNETPDLEDYIGFRDAYSRLGFKASFPLTDNITASFVHEVPLDLANGEVRTPDGRSEKVRVSKAQVSGDWGRVWVGQDWLPYYSHVASKVDLFNSYYSGFASPASLRRGDSIGFDLPIAGLDVSAVYSKGDINGLQRSSTEKRTQLSVSKSIGGLTLSAAVDRIDNTIDSRFYGVAASYTMGNWYFATKYETIASDNQTSGTYAEDGSDFYNILASYTSGLHTYTATAAQADAFGENIFHAGWSYQYTPQTRFFVEYYSEEETALIAPEREASLANDGNFISAASGGQVITAGVRFDF